MKLVMILALILAFSGVGHSATWKVPKDYTCIQEAMNAAVNGDTVLVEPGTYNENLDFMGKAIYVKSVLGPEVTRVDGNKAGSVVSFKLSEGSDSVLEGFTLSNGSGLKIGNKFHGGGIYCNSASPTLRGNIITENVASQGGGIYCLENTIGLITGNRIIDNWAHEGAGIYCRECPAALVITENIITENQSNTYGGGIYLDIYSSPQVLGNTISDNTANDGGGIMCRDHSSPVIDHNLITGNEIMWHGAGISCWYYSAPIITHNVVMNNSTNQSGGGIYSNSSKMTIRNNLIACNSAGNEGGGAYFNSADPIITNNTLYGNTAGKGGGLYYKGSCTSVIMNTILWGNLAPYGSQIWIGETNGFNTVLVAFSNVEAGEGQVHVEPGSTLHWEQTNIDEDPLFVEAKELDLHLSHPSPCRNAGTNAPYGGLPDLDFEGDPRMAEGVADMGADEFHPHLYITGDPTPGGGVAIKLVGYPQSSPVGLWLGFDILDPPLPCPWGWWYLEFPALGPIVFAPIPPEGVAVLSGILPTTPADPYVIAMQALIEDQMTNPWLMSVE